MGHGHVTPNADGSRVRCGGPAICAVCQREAGRLTTRPKAEGQAAPLSEDCCFNDYRDQCTALAGTRCVCACHANDAEKLLMPSCGDPKHADIEERLATTAANVEKFAVRLMETPTPADLEAATKRAEAAEAQLAAEREMRETAERERDAERAAREHAQRENIEARACVAEGIRTVAQLRARAEAAEGREARLRDALLTLTCHECGDMFTETVGALLANDAVAPLVPMLCVDCGEEHHAALAGEQREGQGDE